MLGIRVSKKGVSPLIATILLIAFSVSLGSVVMSWGLNLQSIDSSDKCTEAGIKIKSIDGNDACFALSGATGYINFQIANKGNIEISGLSIWITGQRGTKFFDADNLSIKKGDFYSKDDRDISYAAAELGALKQVLFMPKIISGQSMQVCPLKSIKAEKIGICS